jgi:hypothetical protein
VLASSASIWEISMAADTEIVEPVSGHGSLHEKDNNTNGSDDADGGDYPTGFRLLFVVVALILAIFLTSLDFVSHRSTSKTLKSF